MIHGLQDFAELPPSEAVDSYNRRASLRVVPAEVDASDPVSSSSTPIDQSRRWRLRFTKWQALGNVYLVTERVG